MDLDVTMTRTSFGGNYSLQASGSPSSLEGRVAEKQYLSLIVPNTLAVALLK